MKRKISGLVAFLTAFSILHYTENWMDLRARINTVAKKIFATVGRQIPIFQ